ncbi:Uncharacterised protein [uncultured archaeon]|nr:Uncharacterised protein [uncultured archaeon]
MAHAIALNLRRRVRALQDESASFDPLSRRIVILEAPFSRKFKKYEIDVTDCEHPEFSQPLAFVAVERKIGFMGIGCYDIIDNSKDGLDDVIGRSFTFSGADSKALARALKIARILNKRTGIPVIRRGLKDLWSPQEQARIPEVV